LDQKYYFQRWSAAGSQKCCTSLLLPDHEKTKDHKDFFAFFLRWSKVRVLQKWEETLEKKKRIEKMDKLKGNIKIEKKWK